jgi:hypothetical protein
MPIRTMLIELLLPVILTITFLVVRRRFSIFIYAVAALACVVLAFLLWAFFPTVTVYYRGPLYAGGFDGFAKRFHFG